MSAPRHTAYDLRTQADLLVLAADEMTPEDFDAALADLLGSVEDKAAGYRAVHFALLSRGVAMEEERRRFADAADRVKATMDRVRNGMRALLEAREAVGEEAKIAATWGAMWLQRNGQASMDVVDISQVPAAYIVQPPPPPAEVSRELVIKAHRAGIDIPGVTVTTGRHVRIK